MTEKTGGLLRTPVQERSQNSTNRMLDAAIDILGRDGLAGLTIAAVSRHAGVGTGTIYHRFKDRGALVAAAQDRFLGRLEHVWLTKSAPVWRITDDERFVESLVEAFTKTFAEHRNVFRAFMLTYNDDPALRARGAESSRRFADFIGNVLADRFGCDRRAAHTAYRMMFADATLDAMFTADEVSSSPPNTRQRISHLATALRALMSHAASGPRAKESATKGAT